MDQLEGDLTFDPASFLFSLLRRSLIQICREDLASRNEISSIEDELQWNMRVWPWLKDFRNNKSNSNKMDSFQNFNNL